MSKSDRHSQSLPQELRELYPFASHYHEVGQGIEQHYLDEGQGVPVLMLHGNPTWSFFYRNVVRELSGGFRCIVPDHIGCGLSSKPNDNYPYRLRQHVDNVERLLQVLQIDSFHLIVHDWGGAIGLALAQRYPEKLRTLTVLNTAAFPFPRIPARIAICKVPVLGRALVRGFNAFAGAATRMTTVHPLSKEVKAGYLFPYNSYANRIATHRFVLDIPMHSTHPSYAELLKAERGVAAMAGKPVRIFWGLRDWCFDGRILSEWRRRLPQAEVSVWEDAGHYLLEDRGTQIIPALGRFLKRFEEKQS